MLVAEKEEENNHWSKTSYLHVKKKKKTYITDEMNKVVQLSNFLMRELPVCRLTLRRRRRT